MKNHFIGLLTGVLSVWILTAFKHAEINPFKLTEDVRSGMIGAFIFVQFFLQFAILAYNTKDN